MNQEPQGRALAVLLVLLALGAWFWLRPGSTLQATDAPQPEVTTQASSLSPAARAELLAEVKVRQEGLDRFEEQLKTAQSQPGPSLAVPAATVEEIVRKLDAIEALLANPNVDFVLLRNAREEIRYLWQDRATSLERYLAMGVRSDLPIAPPLDHSLIARLSGDSEAERYERHYLELSQELKRLMVSTGEAFDAELAGRADRLKRVIWLRYRVLTRLAQLNWMALFESPGPWLDDCFFELGNYSDRKYGLYLLARSRLERHVGTGRAFWLGMGRQLGLALIGLVLLSTVLAAADRRDRAQPPGLRGLWVWLAVWPVSHLGLALVTDGVAECLRPIFLLGGLYAIYRAYLQLAGGPLLQAIIHSQVGQKVGVRTRALRDLRLFGRAFWLQATINTILMSLAGPGLLVATSEVLTRLLVQFLYWMLSWSWRVEMGEALAALLPGSPRLGRWLGELCSSPLPGLLFAPLAVPLVIALGFLHWFVRRTVRYDWAKRMSAGVLIRWMEVSRHQEAGQLPLTQAYRDAFLQPSAVPVAAWDMSAPTFRSGLEEAVKAWDEERGADSLMVVHGPNGSGRERVADHLEELFSPSLRVLRLELTERVATWKELLSRLCTLFQVEAISLEALAERLLEQPRTLVIVPQAHRVFLAALGGFEAVDQLLRLISGGRHILFWCLIMTTQSQRYLRLALSERWNVALSLRVPRWTEAALRQMLLERHAAGGGELHYSPAVLRAAEATPGVTPETFFFHILREVSGGNPTVACELWLEAARLDSQQHVVVGLPARKPAHLLTTLAPAAAYLLAAVIRHGELTREQAAQVTALPASQLVLAWDRCQEIGVLAHQRGGSKGETQSPLELERGGSKGETQSLSVTRSWLSDVAYFLKERNLLDGE
jgi:hypothetical protein